MTKSITVEIGGTPYDIKKVPLRKYAELIKAVKSLPKTVGLIDGVSNDKILELLPDILTNSFPDLLNILSIATPIPSDVIDSDDFGLDEALKVVMAIVEVNNYQGVFDTVKKAMASYQTTPKTAEIAPQTTTG